MQPRSRWIFVLATIASLGLAATSARAEERDDPTPAERQADEQARAAVQSDLPAWDPDSVVPWATQNLRLQGGAGLVSLRNPTDRITLNSIGVNGHLHLGDTFWEIFSYYVPVRGTLLSFDAVEVDGTTIDNFNAREGLLVESGLGLEVWLWPKFLVLSVEGVGNFLSLTTQPVRRAEPALAREAVGGAVRGRATVQFEGLGLYAEYTQQLTMVDLTNNTTWEGNQIFVGVTYHAGGKFKL
jgi:hypothetical protein